MSSRQKRSGKSKGKGKLESIPENEPVTMNLPIRAREAPRHEESNAGFVDVPATLDALVNMSPYPPMERPPSRRDHVSGEHAQSGHGMYPQVEPSRKAKVASRDKRLPPLPEAYSQFEDPRGEGSSSASDTAKSWPAAFAGTPRNRSNPRPMPFVGTGQATYKGPTQFNGIMEITIFWDAKNIWGQFTIHNSMGYGYLRYAFQGDGKAAKKGKPFIFFWRGCGGPQQMKVPTADPPPDCTKVDLQFYENGERISGTMRPMDRLGRLNWQRSADGNDYLLAQNFTFTGVREAKSEHNPTNAWEGWYIFNA